nr:MAG TPA: hypothetical protein [Myoviridae sp. ctRUJ25]
MKKKYKVPLKSLNPSNCGKPQYLFSLRLYPGNRDKYS